MTMTIDLDALRKLAADATPGTWIVEEDYHDGLRYSIEIGAADPNEPGEQVIVARCKDECGLHRKLFRREDAAFMAAARSAVPELLDEVERLRAACRQVLAMHEGPPDGVGNWDHAFDMVRAALEER